MCCIFIEDKSDTIILPIFIEIAWASKKWKTNENYPSSNFEYIYSIYIAKTLYTYKDKTFKSHNRLTKRVRKKLHG